MDEDGYVTLVGRAKELIKVSGYSVFPEDVEALLLHHPGIQVGVVGVDDPLKGQVVKAVIVPAERPGPELTAQEVIAWSREQMSAYKVPRHVEFRSSLPTTTTGKILWRLLC